MTIIIYSLIFVFQFSKHASIYGDFCIELTLDLYKVYQVTSIATVKRNYDVGAFVYLDECFFDSVTKRHDV